MLLDCILNGDRRFKFACGTAGTAGVSGQSAVYSVRESPSSWCTAVTVVPVITAYCSISYRLIQTHPANKCLRAILDLIVGMEQFDVVSDKGVSIAITVVSR